MRLRTRFIGGAIQNRLRVRPDERQIASASERSSRSTRCQGASWPLFRSSGDSIGRSELKETPLQLDRRPESRMGRQLADYFQKELGPRGGPGPSGRARGIAVLLTRRRRPAGPFKASGRRVGRRKAPAAVKDPMIASGSERLASNVQSDGFACSRRFWTALAELD